MPFSRYSQQLSQPDLIVIPEQLVSANEIYSNDILGDALDQSPDLTSASQYHHSMAKPNDWDNGNDECMISGLTPNCWTSPDCPNGGTATGPCAALGALRYAQKPPIAARPERSTSRMPSTSDDSTSPVAVAAAAAASVKPAKSRTRLPHNLIERRYRNHLNRQIEALRLAVPALADETMSQVDVEDGIPLRPPSKADIIAASTTYIKELEAKNAELAEHSRKLQEQVDGLQSLVKCDDCSILRYLSSLQLGASPDPQPIEPAGGE